MTIPWLFIVATVALMAGQARAKSLLTQITPATLGHLQLAVTIRCARTAQGEQFRVTVRHKAGAHYHFLQPTEGGLKDGPFANGTEGDTLPCHGTATALGRGATMYRFTLPTHYRADTRFQFGYLGYDAAPSMPVGDFYWFVVSAFAPHKHRKA